MLGTNLKSASSRGIKVGCEGRATTMAGRIKSAKSIAIMRRAIMTTEVRVGFEDRRNIPYVSIHGGSMHYLGSFFVGVFFCNSIPHLACGLLGMPFPTPFAKPRGVGDSPPVVNVAWGFFNITAGLFALSRHPFALDFNSSLIVLLLGGLAMGIYLSLHFGTVRRHKHATRPISRSK